MRKEFATPGVACVSVWPSRARNRSRREGAMTGDLKLVPFNFLQYVTFTAQQSVAAPNLSLQPIHLAAEFRELLLDRCPNESNQFVGTHANGAQLLLAICLDREKITNVIF